MPGSEGRWTRRPRHQKQQVERSGMFVCIREQRYFFLFLCHKLPQT